MIPLLESAYASKGLYQELLGPLCKKYNLTDSEVIILLYLADRADSMGRPHAVSGVDVA